MGTVPQARCLMTLHTKVAAGGIYMYVYLISLWERYYNDINCPPMVWDNKFHIVLETISSGCACMQYMYVYIHVGSYSARVNKLRTAMRYMTASIGSYNYRNIRPVVYTRLARSHTSINFRAIP